jgi:hypothetical protein
MSITPGRRQDINEGHGARETHAEHGAGTDRIEGRGVKKGEPSCPARAGRATLLAFPAALTGRCGQDE